MNTQQSGQQPTANCYFKGGYAWPARDQRSGRYVVFTYSEPEFGMAVVDDFGQLVSVPAVGLLGGTVLALCYFPQGAH